MSKFRLLFIVIALLLTGLVSVSAQAIQPITVADRVLVNFTQAGQSFAYEFNNEAESDTTLFVTYLGQPFMFMTEWYDSSGNLLWVLPVNQTGAANPLRLPADMITIVVSGVGSATGRATISLGVDAPGDDGSVAPAPILPDQPTEGDDPFYTVPQSGTWTLRYIDHENNCPDDILFEDIWMPAPGTTQTLNFSGNEANVGLELHRFVAPEIDEDPSAFEIAMGEFPGSWTVVPGIQTAPFTYYYTISAPNYVQLEYVQRLALSDCELYARFDLIEDGDGGGEMAFSDDFFDLSTWTVFGDGTDLTFSTDDPEAPDGFICARDQSAGETWYFEAPPEVIAAINANRGGVLEYALKLLQDGTQYEQYDVMLTVGNGILLVYQYEYFPMVDSWMYYQIPLYAGAGWVDPDGGMSTDDPAMFEQMMADVTQLHIRGEFLNGSDSACLGNVRLSSWEDAALGG